ncbi:MAG: PKD domain-containing protein [Flavobacteriales bacterium]|nr:PKD domain-containing protein [Flavobacteriales bacterium]
MKKFILLASIVLSAVISHAQCAANFSFSVSGNSVQLTNLSSGTSYYNWHFGDGSASQAINPTHSYAAAGTYDVCLYAYYSDSVGGFCADTICQSITVQDSTTNTPCDADFTYTVSGNTVMFNNTSSGTSANQWYFGDGSTAYSTNPTHTYASAGTYWVCLYSYYDDSLQVTCEDSTCYQVVVQDSLADLWSFRLKEFELYPNPASTVLNVKLDNMPTGTYASIVDLVGREMIRADLTSEITEIPVSELPSGVYMIRLMDAEKGLIGTRKFIRR